MSTFAFEMVMTAATVAVVVVGLVSCLFRVSLKEFFPKKILHLMIFLV